MFAKDMHIQENCSLKRTNIRPKQLKGKHWTSYGNSSHKSNMLAARRDNIEMEKIQEKACNSNHNKYSRQGCK